MSNMRIYDAFRTTPQEALKPITGGRLNGFTDIAPQYRIEALTREFGPCGIGWYYDPVKKWTEPAGEEILCFVDINLFVKADGEWSKPISGTGGSTILAKERNGLRASDEGYKMATTDALSVACKQLGIGADIYWAKGESKYSRPAEQPDTTQPAAEQAPEETSAPNRNARIKALCAHHEITIDTFGAFLKELQNEGKLPKQSTKQMSDLDFNTMLSLVHAALQATKKEPA